MGKSEEKQGVPEEVSHPHPHRHSEEHKKAVLHRLSRAIGHLSAIKTMVEEDRDCSEVLVQLSAVRSEIQNTGKVIVKEHIHSCIREAVEENDTETLTHFEEAIERML